MCGTAGYVCACGPSVTVIFKVQDWDLKMRFFNWIAAWLRTTNSCKFNLTDEIWVFILSILPLNFPNWGLPAPNCVYLKIFRHGRQLRPATRLLYTVRSVRYSDLIHNRCSVIVSKFSWCTINHVITSWEATISAENSGNLSASGRGGALPTWPSTKGFAP